MRVKFLSMETRVEISDWRVDNKNDNFSLLIQTITMISPICMGFATKISYYKNETRKLIKKYFIGK